MMYLILQHNQDSLVCDKMLIEIVQSFIEIANADEFIHENEILLINEAIKTWDIKRELTKDRNDNKLQLINLS